MLKKWLVLAFIPLGLVFFQAHAKADGLDDPMSTMKHLKAPPPPLVEEALPFLSEPEAPVEAPPEVEKDLWPTLSQGMILERPRAGGEIAASEDQKQMLAQGDVIYLSSFGEPFSEGQDWVVFKTSREVSHPKTGASLGTLVRVLGIARVLETNESGATARLVRSKEPIATGDGIAFMEDFFPPDTNVPSPPEAGSAGTIVESRGGRMNIAQNDIVYIDYGIEEGIQEGDRFLIVHGAKRDVFGSGTAVAGLPDRNVGAIQILSTQEHTATAKIIRSIEPIAKGDTVLYQPAE